VEEEEIQYRITFSFFSLSHLINLIQYLLVGCHDGSYFGLDQGSRYFLGDGSFVVVVVKGGGGGSYKLKAGKDRKEKKKGADSL
jgi:hypothetical protein